MTAPYQIRLGGYGPPSTTHSRGLKIIGDELEAQFGDEVDIKYIWNIMDLGYLGKDTLWMAEHGILTMVYQSTSYLTDRVPELGFVDLPFLFRDNQQARAAMDGRLGRHLNKCIEDRVNYKMLGYFENGYRQISNRLRPIHKPSDMEGMRTRVLPSKIQARTFELFGAIPLMIDLTEAIEGVVNGTLDAQENPFANTVTYGVPEFHPYHTLSNHFYISRGLYANRDAFEAFPKPLQVAFQAAVDKATLVQRDLALAEEDIARQAILDAGCEINVLTDEERQLFIDAVKPLHDEARQTFGDEMFDMLAEA
ncbi:MAG: TRAP transporter substrate-binding protein [Proteobacteria bacterium]|nr:TRAP transporter substrate-binding protein [Pseudomonadota bacterium]